MMKKQISVVSPQAYSFFVLGTSPLTFRPVILLGDKDRWFVLAEMPQSQLLNKKTGNFETNHEFVGKYGYHYAIPNISIYYSEDHCFESPEEAVECFLKHYGTPNDRFPPIKEEPSELEKVEPISDEPVYFNQEFSEDDLRLLTWMQTTHTRSINVYLLTTDFQARITDAVKLIRRFENFGFIEKRQDVTKDRKVLFNSLSEVAIILDKIYKIQGFL